MDVRGRAVAAQDFFFVDPHGGGRKLNSSYRVVRGEKQHAPPRSCRCQSVHHHRWVRYCYQDGIGTATLRPGPDLFHKLTITRVKGLQSS